MSEVAGITPSGVERAAFFVVFAVALLIFAYEIYFYSRLLRSFSPERRIDRLPERFSRLLKFVFGQRRLLDQLLMGSAHFMIFWGVIIISFATLEFFGRAKEIMINPQKIMKWAEPIRS